MCSMQGRWVVVAMTASLGALASGSAVAIGSRTVYVDDAGTAKPIGSGQCGSPNYNTIQSAVNDISASRIIVCRGTYEEHITVTRSLSLEGRSGAVIQAPPLGTSSVIVQFAGPQQSRFRGFNVTGASASDDRLFAAVDVRDGARVAITQNHIRHILGMSLGSPTGSGVHVSAATASISENTIERCGSSGVLVFGCAAFAMIDGNTIRRSHAGIEIRECAGGDVEDNTTTGNGTGILVAFTGGVSVRDNQVVDNEVGIVMGESADVEVRSNEVRDNLGDGIRLIDTFRVVVVENESSDNGGHGISVIHNNSEFFGNTINSNEADDNEGNGIDIDLGSVTNTVTENEADNNLGFDIEDDNGPASVYAGNECETSVPSGLCDV